MREAQLFHSDPLLRARLLMLSPGIETPELWCLPSDPYLRVSSYLWSRRIAMLGSWQALRIDLHLHAFSSAWFHQTEMPERSSLPTGPRLLASPSWLSRRTEIAGHVLAYSKLKVRRNSCRPKVVGHRRKRAQVTECSQVAVSFGQVRRMGSC